MTPTESRAQSQSLHSRSNRRSPATKLKIHSDRNFLPDGTRHAVMLCPFWGPIGDDPTGPWHMRYDHYTQTGAEHFEMTSLPEADFVVLPAHWEDLRLSADARQRAAEFAALAEQHNKPVLVFFIGDETEAIDLPGARVFRASCYRASVRANEQPVPAWSEDFVEQYLDGQPVIREKGPRPVVGFCGHTLPVNRAAAQVARDAIRETVGRFGVRIGIDRYPELAGHKLRAQALRRLAASPAIDNRFQFRDRPFGGSVSITREWNWTRFRQARRDYVDNLLDCDYVFCTRGRGNYSFRLYETLSFGRIPVFLNTDCVLPFEDWIDWKRYCVWLEEDDLPRIGEIIAEFHDRISDSEFRDLQHECRRLWIEWLSPSGFFANMHRCLEPKPAPRRIA